MAKRSVQSRYFSDSYSQARTRFANMALAKGLTVDSYTFKGTGSEGEKLTMDTIEWGDPASDNVLFIVSGTHGVEGFAGSACQLALLDQVDTLALSNCRIVLIHAVNPFGFSFLRRTNENNVDINRNFSALTNLPGTDNTQEHAIIRQLRKTSNGYQMVKLYLMLVWQIINGHRAAMQSLITAGQYGNERDLFFGGTHESASAAFWHELLGKYKSSRLYLMDIHTGLGKHGQAHVLSEAQESSSAYQDNQLYFKDCNLVHTAHDTSLSARLTGTLSSQLPEPDNAITLEYGTFGGLTVLSALAIENYHYWHNRNSRQHHRARRHLKAIFNPASPKWQETVLESFWEILARQVQLIHAQHQ